MPVVRLTPEHAGVYRALMLDAYAAAPDAFTATVEERAPMPTTWWERRLVGGPSVSQLVYGAFEDDVLVGVAGLRFGERPRTQHKAVLFGMAVQPAHRGRGLGRALVEAVLSKAASTPGTRLVQLCVTEPNVPARRLYEACGFRAYGTEPYALQVEEGARYLSIIHMWRPVGAEDQALHIGSSD